MIELALDQIDIVGNPRTKVGDVDGLAASIREHGVLEPIRVRRVADRYRLIVGQRRVLASRIAGARTIPAIVEERPPADDLVRALVENLQREDLNALDEARALKALVVLGLSQIEIARKLGRSAPYVSNTLRILETDPFVQEQVALGTLSAAHAKAIGTLSRRDQRGLATKALTEEWSAHRLEREARRLATTSSATRARDPRVPGQHDYAADATTDRLLPRFASIDPAIARVLLWALASMDARQELRVLARRGAGTHGADRLVVTIGRMESGPVAEELATVLGELIREYATTTVRAWLARHV